MLEKINGLFISYFTVETNWKLVETQFEILFCEVRIITKKNIQHVVFDKNAKKSEKFRIAEFFTFFLQFYQTQCA
jgi:hypothetical protein